MKKNYQAGQPSLNPEADTFGTKKKLLYIKTELYEKILNYVYWTPGATITKTINKALAEFLKGKNTTEIFEPDIESVAPFNPIFSKKKKTTFKKPTLEEVKSWVECNIPDSSVDVDYWYKYYEANGWIVGKHKMIDWQRCIKNWHNRNEKWMENRR